MGAAIAKALHEVMSKVGRPPKPAIDRFEAFVQPEPNSGCWLWDGQISAQGYGVFRDGEQKRITAHRFSFAAHKGCIPAGMFVCHTCDVRSCVNPDHLYAGTAAENNDDMHRRGRAVPAFSKTPFHLRRQKEAGI